MKAAPIGRRGFLAASLAAAGSRAAAGSGGASQSSASGGPRYIDTNVYLPKWPFRRIPGEQPHNLAPYLRERGVIEAWAGSFDAVFHKDFRAVNARLVEQCERHGAGFLRPIGAIHPGLTGWERDLDRCAGEHGMAGVRVHPNYHGYTLDDAVFERLLRAAAERNLIVQLVGWLEDERHHPPMMMAPRVDLRPLPEVLEKTPEARLLLLNCVHTVSRVRTVLPKLREFPHVYFDFALLDALLELETLIEQVGAQKVVFGSYSPMFYFECAPLKMREIALPEEKAHLLRISNARRLLGSA